MDRRHFLSASALLGLSACGDSSTDNGAATDTETEANKPTLIATIGDSIGEGGWNSTIRWPDLIGSALNVQILNDSRASREAESAVSIARNFIAKNELSHLCVLLGTNNALRGSVSGAIRALRQVAEMCHAAGVVPVIGTVPAVPRSSAQNAKAAQISEGIRNINANIADIRSAVPANLITDGVHPNNQGQRIIANTFVGSI